VTTAAALLDIDLDAIASNIQLLQSKAPRSKMSGVVKANAYGIGMEQVTRVHQDLGTKTFFVAILDEAIALRRMLGLGPEIAVLGGLFQGAEDEYVAHDLMPVLNSQDDVKRWKNGKPAVLHIDTGMRRLGLDTKETERLIADPALLNGVNIAVVMSHFACADEPGHPLTSQQFEKFAGLAKLFPQARKSLSNSAGIFVSPDYHFGLIRPGMAVYGLNPTPGQPNPMRPVVQLKTRVLQVRDALKGETVGYAASYLCASDRRVATVALGYADGFLRSLSNKGILFWNGQSCPIIGRVSMDLVTLDVTDIKGAPLVAGDCVEVLGPGQDADTLAAAAGTIGYEILTGLGNRYQRAYKGLS
jgi:alanine racemase